MKGFEKLYGRLRRRLPKTKGEVKGRDLSEGEVVEVARILRKIGALFEVVVVDMGMHSKEDLVADSEVRKIFACCSAVSIVRRQNRWMAARMSSADLVHLKGLGFWFVVSM